ncbi:protein NRT1/ PTR FAMILY 1.2-like [Phragmites australis]|uniref:protein NRT1/ PTR FAMILY 1.2-like n=1 Tax=Phragmites australis TaxID=29695 RepID=UPI002D77D2A7|nr:protein NRT1/ PTR FAMILY 1.2-like [Phragmites australis]
MFGAIAQIDFYYALEPFFFGSSVASVVSTVIVKLVNLITGRGGAEPWILDDLNRGRYDFYYLLLAVLGAVDLIYFVICAYMSNEMTQNMSLLEAGMFGAIAQIDFYYALEPFFFGSSVASVVSTVIVKLVNLITGRGGAEPWILDDLNRGRYDFYYLLLAVLGAVDLIYFVICAYMSNEMTQNMSLLEAGGVVEEEEMVEFYG